jgi:hypothetical protein
MEKHGENRELLFPIVIGNVRVGSIKCCNGEDGVRSQVLMDLL